MEPTPHTPMHITTLTQTHSNAYGHVTCSICQAAFHLADDVLILSCLHVFHFRCISRWFDAVSLKGKRNLPELPNSC